MAQLFPKWTNKIPLALGLGGPVGTALVLGAVAYYAVPEYTDVGYAPTQPIPYSHALHVGELELDCRYCHASVEISGVATVPPTQVCMNCHTIIKRDSPLLDPLRESLADNKPLRWTRVHNLPDYAYFNHSVHVRAGVGCVECHGRIDQMEVVTQAKPLSMKWCLDCHRNPQDALRPSAEVTNMEWFPSGGHDEWAAEAAQALHPPVDCSGCHR